MKKVRAFLFLVFAFSSSFLSAQDRSFPEIDSLIIKSNRLLNIHSDSALKYAFKAAEKSQTKNSSYYLARSYSAIGNIYDKLDNADRQTEYLQKAKNAADATSNEKLKLETSVALAEALYNKGKYDEALLLLGKTKTAAEKENNIGILYKIYYAEGTICMHDEESNMDSAFFYFTKALNIAFARHDTSDIADTYRRFGTFYFLTRKYDEAINYIKKAMGFYSKINSIEGLAGSYKELGNIYWKTKDNKKSIEYYTKAYDIYKSRNDIQQISIGACDLAYMYALYKRTDLLDNYGNESYSLAQKTRSWPMIKYSATWLSEAYEIAGNDKKSLFYLKALLSVKDSMTNRASIEKKSREELEGGFQEKVRIIKQEEEKRQAIADEKAHNQKIIRNILIAGFIISSILLILAYNSYVAKKKANLIISQQKKEVEAQKIKIETKNKEITDSINYAKFIQQSILPDPKEIMKTFPNSFGLYKPKDVVSGDFYWFSKSSNIGMIAASDCTGHGVPGALMSMIGVDKLNQAVVNNLIEPSEILSFLNAGVKNTLKQNEGTQISRDGMDIALCCFEFPSPEGEGLGVRLKYAGANRPLWIIREGKLIEYKPTKSAIGGFTSADQKFATHEIELQKNDTIYLSTDGYADQFGGGKGKKMMTKNLKDLLLSIQDMPILEQEKFLDSKFKSWQGEFEQVDDILVIGIRI